MHEDVEPKFLPKKSAVPKPEVKQEPRLIVRNTFLDIEEDEEDPVQNVQSLGQLFFLLMI